jgi:hypothetical protein
VTFKRKSIKKDTLKAKNIFWLTDTFQGIRPTYNYSSVEYFDYWLFPKKTNKEEGRAIADSTFYKYRLAQSKIKFWTMFIS